MGAQGSALAPHQALAPGDLDLLKTSFSKAPPTSLPPAWQVLPGSALQRVNQGLGQGQARIQAYQQLAGNTARGSLDSQISFLMQLSGTSTTSFTSSEIHSAVDLLLSSFCHSLGKKAEDADLLATSLLHDTVFPGQKRKATAGKEAPVLDGLDLGVIESLFLSQPLLEATLQRLLLHLFTLPPRAQLAPILPSIDPPSSTSLSTLQQIFLASALPHHLRALWRPLFNTDLHGESFSKFAGNIINQGPTLIVIWDEVGNVFGGFATDSWKLGPKFYGKPESFLFQLAPTMGVFDTPPFNSNYQYFNLKQKTMPNGLGMGGQLEYFGLWIDSEFGLVKTSPTCSTYHLAPLGQPEGKIVKLEVIGIGELDEEDMEAGRSVLDLDPEAQAVLEMMGKTFHSKVIREVDEDNDRKDEILKQVKEQEK